MAGIFWAIVAYLGGGVWSALAFTRVWRKEGRALGWEWIELAVFAFILWPLILSKEIFRFIKGVK